MNNCKITIQAEGTTERTVELSIEDSTAMPTISVLLHALKKLGATFSQVVEVLGESKAQSPFIAAAEEHYGTDDVEVDEHAFLSQADNGTWVSAWLYVSNELAGVEMDEEEEEEEEEIAKAEVISAVDEQFHVRVENGDFWADDGVPIVFSLREGIAEAHQFLSDTSRKSMGYVSSDVEFVRVSDQTVVNFSDILASVDTTIINFTETLASIDARALIGTDAGCLSSKQTCDVKVVVLCQSSEGETEFYYTTVPDLTPLQIDAGEHFDFAKQSAEDNGYGGPMVAFSETDPAAKQLGEVLAWI